MVDRNKDAMRKAAEAFLEKPADGQAMNYFRATATPAAVRALIAENEALKAMTARTMGVGSGDGKLFVHGDYDSIKAARDIVFERDRLKAELERVRAEAELLRKHLTECADSLESEILDRYGSSKDHPAIRRKFECDMQEVIEARAALGKGGKA